MATVVFLEGEKISLRPIERSDAATIQPWVNDQEVTRTLLLFRPVSRETEEEFAGLLDFVQAIQFDKVGVFTFSPEPDTPAFDMPNQVAEAVKEDRRARVRRRRGAGHHRAPAEGAGRHRQDRQRTGGRRAPRHPLDGRAVETRPGGCAASAPRCRSGGSGLRTGLSARHRTGPLRPRRARPSSEPPTRRSSRGATRR